MPRLQPGVSQLVAIEKDSLDAVPITSLTLGYGLESLKGLAIQGVIGLDLFDSESPESSNRAAFGVGVNTPLVGDGTFSVGYMWWRKAEDERTGGVYFGLVWEMAPKP